MGFLFDIKLPKNVTYSPSLVYGQYMLRLFNQKRKNDISDFSFFCLRKDWVGAWVDTFGYVMQCIELYCISV